MNTLIILSMIFQSSRFIFLSPEYKMDGEYIGKLQDIFVFLQSEKQISTGPENLLNKRVLLSLYPFYKSMGFKNISPETGEYLIITTSSFLSFMNKFIEWKEKSGYKVITEIITGSESPQDIKNLIQFHYQNDTIPLEYVLLVGDVEIIPTFFGSPWTISDNKFVTLEGNDFIPDVLIGRMSVSTSGELLTVLAKTLSYEKNPETVDTSWFKRALAIGAHYPVNVWTPKKTKQWIRQFLLQSGTFDWVDSVYYPPTSNGVGPITSSINNGVLFVNYRGGDAESRRWIYPQFGYLDVDGLSNGAKLPIVTSFVCLTGAFDDNAPMCLGEKWIRAGNPSNMKGAVAFIGSGSAGTHTRGNNALDELFYTGYAKNDFPGVASLLLYAKLALIPHLPNELDPDSGAGFYFYTYNILGDPSLILYKGVPQGIQANLPSSISTGSSSLNVRVTKTGSPIKDAWVSLFKPDEVREFSLTDTNGESFFNFSPVTAGTLYVTVRGTNIYPLIQPIPVSGSNTFVGIQNFQFSDSVGHGDNLITPSETLNLTIAFKNFGSQGVTGTTIQLQSMDSLADISDSIEFLGNLSPGEVKNGLFTFSVSPSCTTEHRILFKTLVQANEGNWTHYIDAITYAPDFQVDSVYVLDADGYPEPGETENLVIELKNTGNFFGTNIQATLKALSSKVQIIDSVSSFGQILPDSSSSNLSNPFVLSFSPNAFLGEKISLRVQWTTDSEGKGAVDFSVKIGAPSLPSYATGPSAYGYYVLDDQDTTFQNAPIFSWTEIDPNWGGSGNPLNLSNDTTVTLGLPFLFKYFGINYSNISVSSNGFLIFGASNVSDPYNWPIPASTLPDRFIAPFWDDFDPTATDSSGDVYTYYDTQNNIFIIEWSRVQHIHNYLNPIPSELASFELILYDPDYYSTPTGDGVIKLQYLSIQDDDQWHNFSTTGFESPRGEDGIQIAFNGIKADGIPNIQPGRAFLISTITPVVYITEIERKKKLTILMPTITRGSFSVYIFPSGENIPFRIYDITGRVQDRGLVKNSSLHIDGNVLRKSGIFFLTFDTGNNKIKRKFVFFK